MDYESGDLTKLYFVVYVVRLTKLCEYVTVTKKTSVTRKKS